MQFGFTLGKLRGLEQASLIELDELLIVVVELTVSLSHHMFFKVGSGRNNLMKAFVIATHAY